MNSPFALWVKSHKWRLLLLGIVALLVISPVSEVYDEQDDVITPLVALIIMAVLLGTAKRKVTLGLLLLLTLVWLGVSQATEGSGLFAGSSLLAPLLFLILLAALFGLLARWMIAAVHVNVEVICAAICGYLLLGIFWMGLYALAQAANGFHHGAQGLFVSMTSPTVSFGDLLYFSYTTLTTTGFGDITPRAPIVRMLTVMEAMTGLFYNTIVIARFVSLYGRSAGQGSQG